MLFGYSPLLRDLRLLSSLDCQKLTLSHYWKQITALMPLT